MIPPLPRGCFRTATLIMLTLMLLLPEALTAQLSDHSEPAESTPAGPLPADAEPAALSAVVSVFWREGCGHCKKEKEFLAALQKEMDGLDIQWYNVAEPGQREMFESFTAKHNLPKVTPITLVGLKYIVGFDTPDTTGEEIRWLLQTEQTDLTLAELLGMTAEQGSWGEGTCPEEHASTPLEAEPAVLRYLTLPLIGRIDISQFTLPMLSLVLGLVDGFNPCAMWVLVAFLTALAQVGSLKKMIQFTSIFILAQGIMYMLILNSWLIAFDFIRADRIVTPVIGLVAIGGGFFFLWEFATSKGACKITGMEKRSRTLSRLRELSRRSLTPVVILGILGVALSVNVVEFACSIGIPQAYTKILDLNRVDLWQREFLMSIYILFYMLDDLFVFGIAIWSIEKIGLSTKYTRLSNLLGGIIMLALGALLLFAPEKLRF
jgi:cytochrome c biogenesis protein CcdA